MALPSPPTRNPPARIFLLFQRLIPPVLSCSSEIDNLVDSYRNRLTPKFPVDETNKPMYGIVSYSKFLLFPEFGTFFTPSHRYNGQHVTPEVWKNQFNMGKHLDAYPKSSLRNTIVAKPANDPTPVEVENDDIFSKIAKIHCFNNLPQPHPNDLSYELLMQLVGRKKQPLQKSNISSITKEAPRPSTTDSISHTASKKSNGTANGGLKSSKKSGLDDIVNTRMHRKTMMGDIEKDKSDRSLKDEQVKISLSKKEEEKKLKSVSSRKAKNSETISSPLLVTLNLPKNFVLSSTTSPSSSQRESSSKLPASSKLSKLSKPSSQASIEKYEEQAFLKPKALENIPIEKKKIISLNEIKERSNLKASTSIKSYKKADIEKGSEFKDVVMDEVTTSKVSKTLKYMDEVTASKVSNTLKSMDEEVATSKVSKTAKSTDEVSTSKLSKTSKSTDEVAMSKVLKTSKSKNVAIDKSSVEESESSLKSSSNVVKFNEKSKKIVEKSLKNIDEKLKESKNGNSEKSKASDKSMPKFDATSNSSDKKDSTVPNSDPSRSSSKKRSFERESSPNSPRSNDLISPSKKSRIENSTKSSPLVTNRQIQKDNTNLKSSSKSKKLCTNSNSPNSPPPPPPPISSRPSSDKDRSQSSRVSRSSVEFEINEKNRSFHKPSLSRSNSKDFSAVEIVEKLPTPTLTGKESSLIPSAPYKSYKNLPPREDREITVSSSSSSMVTKRPFSPLPDEEGSSKKLKTDNGSSEKRNSSTTERTSGGDSKRQTDSGRDDQRRDGGDSRRTHTSGSSGRRDREKDEDQNRNNKERSYSTSGAGIDADEQKRKDRERSRERKDKDRERSRERKDKKDREGSRERKDKDRERSRERKDKKDREGSRERKDKKDREGSRERKDKKDRERKERERSLDRNEENPRTSYSSNSRKDEVVKMERSEKVDDQKEGSSKKDDRSYSSNSRKDVERVDDRNGSKKDDKRYSVSSRRDDERKRDDRRRDSPSRFRGDRERRRTRSKSRSPGHRNGDSSSSKRKEERASSQRRRSASPPSTSQRTSDVSKSKNREERDRGNDVETSRYSSDKKGKSVDRDVKEKLNSPSPAPATPLLKSNLTAFSFDPYSKVLDFEGTAKFHKKIGKELEDDSDKSREQKDRDFVFHKAAEVLFYLLILVQNEEKTKGAGSKVVPEVFSPPKTVYLDSIVKYISHAGKLLGTHSNIQAKEIQAMTIHGLIEDRALHWTQVSKRKLFENDNSVKLKGFLKDNDANDDDKEMALELFDDLISLNARYVKNIGLWTHSDNMAANVYPGGNLNYPHCDYRSINSRLSLVDAFKVGASILHQYAKKYCSPGINLLIPKEAKK